MEDSYRKAVFTMMLIVQTRHLTESYRWRKLLKDLV